MWIIINKTHFFIFSDYCTHKSIKPQRRRYNSEASAKWKEVKEKPDNINELILKTKADNSHPWIIYFFNWLVIIWRRGVMWNWMSKIKGVKSFERKWTRGVGGVMKIGQFSWMSYLYHPLAVYEGSIKGRLGRIGHLTKFCLLQQLFAKKDFCMEQR